MTRTVPFRLASLALGLFLAACGQGPAPSSDEGGRDSDQREAGGIASAPAASEISPSTSAETAAPSSTETRTPEPEDAAFANFPAPYNTASYTVGRRTFKLCQSCHIIAEGGGNLVGPNLHGLFGRKAGSVKDFAYSSALQNAGFVWTPEKLEEWLASPSGFLPGNNMSFAGVRKPEDRHAVIAYIMLQSGYSAEGQATPSGAAAKP